MTRLRLALAVCATLTTATSVHAADPGGHPRRDGQMLSRDVLLGIGLGVNAVAGSFMAYELATSDKVLAVSAASFVVTTPILALTGIQLGQHPDDALLWGTAVLSTVVLVKTGIDVVRGHDPRSRHSNDDGMHINPTVAPMQDSVFLGIDLAGQF